MESQGWWNGTDEEELKSRLKQDVLTSFRRAETLKKADLKELFTDVYAEEPWNIVSLVEFVSDVYSCRLQKEQREELAGLLKKYGQVWEPWRDELKNFKDEGKKLLD
jgi:2-oxoisovalerate dehydrogenase E1 component alpha subunit